jgi:hypothetical protein
MRHALLCTLVLCACGSDKLPYDNASLTLTCQYRQGQCVDFSGLSTADHASASTGCAHRFGTELSMLCPTASRLGTCTIPPTGPDTDVTCSAQAVIAIRYYAPFTADSAQSACSAVTGAVWTPDATP